MASTIQREEQNLAHEPPAKKARKSTGGGISKTELNAKIKAATESEMKAFVLSLYAAHSDILAPDFQAFQPRLMPVKPAKDDPLLNQCFSCKENDELTVLHKSEAMQICHGCRSDLFGKYPDTCTREKVMSFFHFTKAEADKIPRSSAACGLFKNQKCFVYQLDNVVKAVKKKHGSLYMMAKGN